MMSDSFSPNNHQRLNKCTLFKFTDELKLQKFLQTHQLNTDNYDQIVKTTVNTSQSPVFWAKKKRQNSRLVMDKTIQIIYKDIKRVLEKTEPRTGEESLKKEPLAVKKSPNTRNFQGHCDNSKRFKQNLEFLEEKLHYTVIS